VQDAWITPARDERVEGAPAPLDWYGTTVRWFDAANQLWRAVWFNPVSGFRVELEGRRQGDDIVQVGMRGGRPIRWTFSDIRADSFVWRGHILEPDGVTWRPDVEIHAQRLEPGV
jgi:hypothetical protein